MEQKIVDDIKLKAQKMTREFCSGLLDVSQGDEELFKDFVCIFARQVAKEVHHLIPSDRATAALDTFKNENRN